LRELLGFLPLDVLGLADLMGGGVAYPRHASPIRTGREGKPEGQAEGAAAARTRAGRPFL
jgi:hypothetical protein